MMTMSKSPYCNDATGFIDDNLIFISTGTTPAAGIKVDVPVKTVLVQITQCRDCPYSALLQSSEWGVDLELYCRKEKRQLASSEYIPQWCPLPDVKKIKNNPTR